MPHERKLADIEITRIEQPRNAARSSDTQRRMADGSLPKNEGNMVVHVDAELDAGFRCCAAIRAVAPRNGEILSLNGRNLIRLVDHQCMVKLAFEARQIDGI